MLFEIGATSYVINSLCVDERYRQTFFTERRFGNDHFDPAR